MNTWFDIDERFPVDGWCLLLLANGLVQGGFLRVDGFEEMGKMVYRFEVWYSDGKNDRDIYRPNEVLRWMPVSGPDPRKVLGWTLGEVK